MSEELARYFRFIPDDQTISKIRVNLLVFTRLGAVDDYVVSAQTRFEFKNHSRNLCFCIKRLEDAQIRLKRGLATHRFFWIDSNLEMIVNGHLVQK